MRGSDVVRLQKPNEAGPSYRLSSGREFWTMASYISLSEEGHVGVGLDSDLDGEMDDWTRAERAELADFMIERWTVFREAKP